MSKVRFDRLWRRVRGSDAGAEPTGGETVQGYEHSGTWFAVPVEEECIWHDGYEPIRKRMPHERIDAQW